MAVALSSCMKRTSDHGKVAYFRTFSGKGVPLAPAEQVDEATAKSQEAYCIAHFDDQGRVSVLEKYWKARLFFRHEYTYDKDGNCVLAIITDENGNKRELRLGDKY